MKPRKLLLEIEVKNKKELNSFVSLMKTIQLCKIGKIKGKIKTLDSKN